MKIFVSGAAGFVGSRLSAALLARGDSVVGLDNFHPYYDPARKERNLEDLLPHPNFQFVRGDLRDAPLLLELFQKSNFEAVAHVAAMAAVRYSVAHPLIYGEVNVQGTLNVLDAARQTTKPRCILASTGSVYGADTPVPFLESAAAVLPLAPYPASKRAMELFAHSFAHLYEIPTTVLRFFNVYGPHGRPDMMPWQWTMKILQNEPLTLFNAGRMKRDWTFVDDIVAGFMASLDAGLKWEIINLGCGRPVENLRFVEILEEILGQKALIVEAPVPPSEPLETFASIQKARELLNWEPKVEVEEGLRRFIEWLRAEGLVS